MKLSFEVYLNVVDRIQVWTIRWMIINGNFVEVKKFGDNFGLMDWGIVLLKSSTTNCIIDVLNNRQDKKLKQPQIDRSLD